MECHVKLVCKTSSKNCIVGVVQVYDVKDDIFCSCILLITKGYRQGDFSQGLPLNPIFGVFEGCRWPLLSFIWSKALTNYYVC
jgi:hypothetical protein